jgi:hypothetical protein
MTRKRTLAPLLMRYLIIGTATLILVSSSDTMWSALTKTFFPSKSFTVKSLTLFFVIATTRKELRLAWPETIRRAPAAWREKDWTRWVCDRRSERESLEEDAMWRQEVGRRENDETDDVADAILYVKCCQWIWWGEEWEEVGERDKSRERRWGFVEGKREGCILFIADLEAGREPISKLQLECRKEISKDI